MIALPIQRSAIMAKRTKFQVRSDAAKQRWHVRDDKKEGFWRGHLESWKKSGLSKRAYCTQHNLAYSSFMAWRREIELRDRENDPPSNVAALLSQPTERANPFVPVRIVADKVVPAQSEAPAESGSSKEQSIEITLPSGAVIRLHDGCDPTFVAKLLCSLKQ
jgi:hypothetical protein